METYTIQNRKISFFGKLNGSNDCKFNRIAKLAAKFNSNLKKMDGFIERGVDTKQARLAMAVKLLMVTGIRVGNEASAEGYMTQPHPNNKKRQPEFVQTYGLTTLLAEHVEIGKSSVMLHFTGKAAVENFYKISDRKLVSQIKAICASADGTWLGISHGELTRFIKTYIGAQFSPKDFRTLKANVEAWTQIEQLVKLQAPRNKTEANAEVKAVAVHVSNVLNNTPSVCKTSYIDPSLFDYQLNVRYYAR